MGGNGDTAVADGGPHTSRHHLDLRECTPALLGRVRAWIMERLVGLPRTPVADVVLAADELVTNAYEHGDGPRALHLCRTADPCVIRLEVADSNCLPVTVGQSRLGTTAHRGRGLVLVEQLSQSWGVERPAGAEGKTVWAEILCEDG